MWVDRLKSFWVEALKIPLFFLKQSRAVLKRPRWARSLLEKLASFLPSLTSSESDLMKNDQNTLDETSWQQNNALQKHEDLSTPDDRLPLFEKLEMLRQIVAVASKPCLALTVEDIVGLILDLGITLCNSEEYLKLGEEVGESQKQTADVLGNVLMIHKTLTGLDHDILKNLGEDLLEVGHKALRRETKHRQFDLATNIPLEDADETSVQSYLGAKRLIRNLRQENSKLDRRNNNLWFEKQRLEERLGKKIPLPKIVIKPSKLKNPDSLLNFIGSSPESEVKPNTSVSGNIATPANRICTSVENGSKIPQSRKLRISRHCKPQTDCLQFE